MIVDTIFLHDFLLCQQYESNSECKVSGCLYNFTNSDISHGQILVDLLLIGNQIPMSFLNKIIKIPKKPDVELTQLYNHFIKIVTGANIFSNTRLNEVTDDKQLVKNILDFLYVWCT